MLSYSEFKLKKEREPLVVEGIIGKAISSMKDKFALSISKKIGGAKKVDKTINLRKEELKEILNTRLKLEEELLLSKRAFEDSDGDDNLRTQYEQKKKSVTGQIGAIVKKDRASQKKFTLTLNQMKAKGNDSVKGYADLQEANMELELADIEFQAYKKMGRDTSKLEGKIKKQSEKIETKKSELKKAFQKTKEEAKDTSVISKGQIYDYTNSKGAQLQVKVISSEIDREGYWKVVNVEKEGDTDGFRVKPEDLIVNKDVKQKVEER